MDGAASGDDDEEGERDEEGEGDEEGDEEAMSTSCPRRAVRREFVFALFLETDRQRAYVRTDKDTGEHHETRPIG